MTFKDIKDLSIEAKIPLHEAVLMMELSSEGNSPEYTKKELGRLLEVILEESERTFGTMQKTLTGLTGENAAKMNSRKPDFFGRFVHTAIVTALSVSESNASMGRIVACPTAGASGLIPGIFYALKRIKKITFNKLLEGFIVAAGVGNVIASKASLSGAFGGCQAEIGSAAAMGAAGLVYIFDKDPEKADSAAALALKSLMGLVCDPIGGYVEVPCVKRNGTIVSLSITCAEMALSGINSVVPFDETVTAMKKVGLSLPYQLKETGLGGIADTETARKFKSRNLDI